MKKKLLFSFAVFATALTVNAQKKFVENEDTSLPVKFQKETPQRTDVTGDKSYYYWENNSRVTKELNTFLGKTGASDGGFDTLGLYTYKFKEKTTSSTYWQMGIQGFPTEDALTLNNIKFVGSSLNPNGANVIVNVYKKDLTTLLATKTLAVNSTYGYNTVTFDTPVTDSDSMLVTFQMATVADSFQIAKSHNQWVGSTLGTANKFTSSLPFPGDAAILAMSQNYAGVLGLIQDSLDFFIIPSFTYKLKADFTLNGTCVVSSDSVIITNNANPSLYLNPRINYIQWDYLANGNSPAYTSYNFGDATPTKYSKSQSISYKYSSNGSYVITAKPMIGTWTIAPYVLEDSLKLNVTIASSKPLASSSVVDAKCFGEKAVVTISGTGGTGAITGTGDFNVDAKAGVLKYAVVDANTCTSDSISVTIKDAPAKLSATTSSIAAHGSSKDGSASVNVSGGTAPYSYAWVGSSETTSVITVANGTYTATITDANNCTLTADAITVAISSIQDLAISALSIYPNPVANELNVKFNANSAATIELVNVAGQVIESKNANQFANVTFNTSALNAGVYFVNIKVAEGTFTQKIVKE